MFCLPLSSCYNMVDIFLQSRQDEVTSHNSSLFFEGDKSACSNLTTYNHSACTTDLMNSPAVAGSHVTESSIYLFDDVKAYWIQAIWICVLHNCLILVGLVGNILNIIILSKHGIGSNTTNILLMTLAAIDCAMLLSNGIQNMTCFTCYLEEKTAVYVDTVTNIYLTSPSRWISFVNLDITALIAIERALAVFLPFKVARLFSLRTIVVTFTIISITMLIAILPHMIGVKPYWQFDPNFNDTVTNTFEFMGNFDNFLIFWGVLENANAFACVTIILLCGTATAIKMFQQYTSRKAMIASRQSYQERKAVTMLLLICLISFLVHLPNSVNQLYSSLFLDQLAKDGMYCALRALGTFLGTLNASVNFFIYFFMSSKFKETYQSLFRGCQRRENTNNENTAK